MLSLRTTLTVSLISLTIAALMCLATPIYFAAEAIDDAQERRSDERYREWREQEDLKKYGRPPSAERARDHRAIPVS